MTSHPITPTPELVQQWREQAPRYRDGGVGREAWLMVRAAQWGADQELEACCEWLEEHNVRWDILMTLRAARRPQPQSLKKQALAVLESVAVHELYGNATADNRLSADDMRTIRRALEALPE